MWLILAKPLRMSWHKKPYLETRNLHAVKSWSCWNSAGDNFLRFDIFPSIWSERVRKSAISGVCTSCRHDFLFVFHFYRRWKLSNCTSLFTPMNIRLIELTLIHIRPKPTTRSRPGPRSSRTESHSRYFYSPGKTLNLLSTAISDGGGRQANTVLITCNFVLLLQW